MAFSLPQITPAGVQSAFTRIPLATKGIVLIIVLFYFSSFSFGFQSWAQLAPDKVFSGGGTSIGLMLCLNPFWLTSWQLTDFRRILFYT